MKTYLIVLCLSIFLCPLAAIAEENALITRDTRIKKNNGKIYAVVPFYQWYLDKYGLTKDDMRSLNYPVRTKYGVAKPFMQHKWGAESGDSRVKLKITYSSVPTEDVVNISS